MHIHIIGICGTFMGGLAALAQAAGHRVTGCDAHVYPPMSTQLEALGIKMTAGFDAQQLEEFPADMYVIGNVAKRGQAVIEAILDRGLPYCSGPQWLREHILRDHWVLAVAGTHGKTTTSAMLAWILEKNGYAPGFLIGGVPENFLSSARLASSCSTPNGRRGFFVIEADEYDTAFFDKRSKFLHYPAQTAILNNLEFDHADIFSDIAAIETQFHHFIRTLPSSARIVVNAQNEALQHVLTRGIWSEVEYFGSKESLWRVSESDEHGHFDVLFQNKVQGKITWNLMGEHNKLNALAAISAAHHIGIAPQNACAALNEFLGVKRRMQLKGTVRNISVYDDFAHHPSAIATTLQGLHARTQARILAVLEPRSNTMKLGTMKTQLADSLKLADHVFCFAPNTIQWNAQEALQSLGDKAQTFADLNELITAICQTASSGDQILIMSNGGFGGIHETLLTQLAI